MTNEDSTDKRWFDGNSPRPGEVIGVWLHLMTDNGEEIAGVPFGRTDRLEFVLEGRVVSIRFHPQAMLYGEDNGLTNVFGNDDDDD